MVCFVNKPFKSSCVLAKNRIEITLVATVVCSGAISPNNQRSKNGPFI